MGFALHSSFMTIIGSILLCVEISTTLTRNIFMPSLDGKGNVLLSLWPTDYQADYRYRHLELSPYVPVHEMSTVWFLIGTISSQSNITGVIREVMGTRWWRDGDEPLLSLSSLHLSSMWFSFCALLILSVRLLGFILLCCRQNVLGFFAIKIAFGFQHNCRRLNQCALTSPHTPFIFAMIDPTGSIALSYCR